MPIALFILSDAAWLSYIEVGGVGSVEGFENMELMLKISEGFISKMPTSSETM